VRCDATSPFSAGRSGRKLIRVRHVMGLAESLITGRMGFPMTVPCPLENKCCDPQKRIPGSRQLFQTVLVMEPAEDRSRGDPLVARYPMAAERDCR